MALLSFESQIEADRFYWEHNERNPLFEMNHTRLFRELESMRPIMNEFQRSLERSRAGHSDHVKFNIHAMSIPDESDVPGNRLAPDI